MLGHELLSCVLAKRIMERSGALWEVLECFRNVLERFSAFWNVLDTFLMKNSCKIKENHCKKKQIELLETVIEGCL